MKHPTKYAKLFNGQQISLNVNPGAALKDPSTYTVVGQPVARLDLPDKCTGRFQFVSDIVLPGMLHGRVVRVNGGVTGPSKPKNATSPSVDDSAARAIPGFVQTVQKGNFVGVVATTSGRRSRRRKRSRSPGATAQLWSPTRSRLTCRQP